MNAETMKMLIGPIVRQSLAWVAAWLVLSPTPETMNHTTDFLVAAIIAGIGLLWSNWSDRKLLQQEPPPPTRQIGNGPFASMIALACMAAGIITMVGCAEAPGFRGSIDDQGITTLDGGSTRLFGDGNRWGSSGNGSMSQGTADAEVAQQQSGGAAPNGAFHVRAGADAINSPFLLVSGFGASNFDGEDVELYGPDGKVLFKARKISRKTSEPGKVAVDLAVAEAERLMALPVEQRTVEVEKLKQQADAGNKVAAGILDALVKIFVPAP